MGQNRTRQASECLGLVGVALDYLGSWTSLGRIEDDKYDNYHYDVDNDDAFMSGVHWNCLGCSEGA